MRYISDRIIDVVARRLIIAAKFRGLFVLAVIVAISQASPVGADPAYFCALCGCDLFVEHLDIFPEGCSSFGLFWPIQNCGFHEVNICFPPIIG